MWKKPGFSGFGRTYCSTRPPAAGCSHHQETKNLVSLPPPGKCDCPAEGVEKRQTSGPDLAPIGARVIEMALDVLTVPETRLARFGPFSLTRRPGEGPPGGLRYVEPRARDSPPRSFSNALVAIDTERSQIRERYVRTASAPAHARCQSVPPDHPPRRSQPAGPRCRTGRYCPQLHSVARHWHRSASSRPSTPP